jgi:hypothetical protein
VYERVAQSSAYSNSAVLAITKAAEFLRCETLRYLLRRERVATVRVFLTVGFSFGRTHGQFKLRIDLGYMVPTVRSRLFLTLIDQAQARGLPVKVFEFARIVEPTKRNRFRRLNAEARATHRRQDFCFVKA